MNARTIDEYPQEAWRPRQKEYAKLVQAIARSTEPIRVGIEGPCGSGKSLGYLRAVMAPDGPPCNILSTTRQHLRQLEATLQEHFPGGSWAILRGKSWYSCCGEDAPDPDVDAHAAEWGPSKACPRGDKCLYLEAIQACAAARVVVQCTIGFLFRKQAWMGLDDARQAIVDRELVVVDEAHEYSGVRRSFETHELPIRSADWDNGKLIQSVLKERVAPGTGYMRGYVLLSDGPGKALLEPIMRVYMAMLDEGHIARKRPALCTDAKWEVKKKAYEDNVKARLAILESACLVDAMAPVVSIQWGKTSLGVETVNLVSEPAYAAMWTELAPKEIFTSATLRPCAATLKIKPDNLIVFPEIFDWATAVQPMALEDSTPDKRGNTAISADLVESLYNSPGRPVTLLLFISKAHVHQASAKVRGKPGVKVQGADGDLSDLVEQANDCFEGPPTFLLAYSGWVGVDIPGAKWLVLGSSTKSPLNALYTARKLRRIGGGWQDADKVTADSIRLQQGLGRALRSAEDRAVVIWTDNAAFQEAGMDVRTGRLARS